MATVYHAVQEGPLDFENEVAIKLVHPELMEDHPQLRRGLVDEARIAARIRHPNVVRILDLVQEGDRFYMVMDFVDGVSMRRVLDVARETGRPAPIGPVLEVLAAAARGVDAAHQLTLPDGSPGGLVHRDMKPGNILVSHDGHVKVSDFGIAMFADRVSESTQAGQMKGTPAYMSPEQILGEPLSARSDIFSLGLTLYTLLTSRLVFQAETAMAVALAIAHKPMDDQAAELEAMLPGLGYVFTTATRRNPDERFLDGTTLADALTELHHTIRGPASISEMVVATGWRPFSKDGPPPPEDDEEPTDPNLLIPDEMATLADARTPAGGAAQLGAEEPSQRIVVQPAGGFLPELDYEEEPTVAEVAIPIGDTTDHGPIRVADLNAQDPEITPVTAHGAPPLVDPMPGPTGAPIIDVAPVAAQSRPLPPPPRLPPGPPPPGIETTMPQAPVARPHVQPERDFRGRVIRKNTLQQNTSVGRAEKIGVAVAFVLLLTAVITITVIQIIKPVPPDRDPRLVGEDALPAAPVARPAAEPPPATEPAAETIAAEPTALPASPPSASAPSLEDRLRAARGEPAAASAEPKAEPKPKVTPKVTPKAEPKPVAKAEPKAEPKPKAKKEPVAAAEEPAEPPAAEPGTLVVNSYPWSNVFVDGKSVGRTPVRGMELPAGKHSVKLVFPSVNNQEITQSVTIEAGGKASVIKKLDAP